MAAESTRECQALISKEAGSGLYQPKVKLKLECDETHTSVSLGSSKARFGAKAISDF